MQKIVLASNNAGKVAEIKSLLRDLPIALLPQSDLNVPEVPETGHSFIENATIKAQHAAQLTQLPALADDSGLAIDALDGAPGIYSARYAGENATDDDRIKKVLNALKDTADDQRSAQFHCAIVLVCPDHQTPPLICHGVWSGTILHEARGHQGFGYDPIFYVPSEQCSAAELAPQLKNQISHRGLALAQLRQKIDAFLKNICPS
jgi:XTP/dITP diphosphohydrolase